MSEKHNKNFQANEKYAIGLYKKPVNTNATPDGVSPVKPAGNNFIGDVFIKSGDYLINELEVNNLEELLILNPEGIFKAGKEYRAFIIEDSPGKEPRYKYFDTGTASAPKLAPTKKEKPEVPLFSEQLQPPSSPADNLEKLQNYNLGMADQLKQPYTETIAVQEKRIEDLLRANQGLQDRLEDVEARPQTNEYAEKVIEHFKSRIETLEIELQEQVSLYKSLVYKNAEEKAKLLEKIARQEEEIKYLNRRHDEHIQFNQEKELFQEKLINEAKTEYQEKLNVAAKGMSDKFDEAKAAAESSNQIWMAAFQNLDKIGPFIQNIMGGQQQQKPVAPQFNPAQSLDPYFLKLQQIFAELKLNYPPPAIMNFADELKAQGTPIEQITVEYINNLIQQPEGK